MWKSALVIVLAVVISFAVLTAADLFSERLAEEGTASDMTGTFESVMPEGSGFAELDITPYALPESVAKAYSEIGGGLVFELNATGYYPGMIILCGIDPSGKVTGAECIESGESLGKEKTYGENAVGLTLDTVGELDTVAGATKTTKGYKKAIRDALEAHRVLSGMS